MLHVDELAIAIGAFDPACIPRDAQPDTWMTEGTFAAVTCNAIAVHHLGFRRFDGHGLWYPSELDFLALLCVSKANAARPRLSRLLEYQGSRQLGPAC